MKNHYEILGVANNATQEEIKRAYKKLALLYHPDKNPNNPKAATQFILINEAYQILSNSDRRRNYDYESNVGKFYNWESKQQKQNDYQAYQEAYRRYQEEQKDIKNQYAKYESIYQKWLFIGIVLVIVLSIFIERFMNGVTANGNYENAKKYYSEEQYYEAKNEISKAISRKENETKFLLLETRITLEYSKEINIADNNDADNAISILNNQKEDMSQKELAEYFFLKGVALYKKSKITEALKDIAQSERLGYVYGELFFYKALCMEKLSLQEEMIQQNFKSALDLGYTRASVHIK